MKHQKQKGEETKPSPENLLCYLQLASNLAAWILLRVYIDIGVARHHFA
jgi:hypothetical protein